MNIFESNSHQNYFFIVYLKKLCVVILNEKIIRKHFSTLILLLFNFFFSKKSHISKWFILFDFWILRFFPVKYAIYVKHKFIN